MTDTLPEIARGLSKAQRAAIRDGRETLFGRQIVLSVRIHPKVADNLMNLGIAVLHDPFRLRLTDAGLAIRTHILTEGQQP